MNGGSVPGRLLLKLSGEVLAGSGGRNLDISVLRNLSSAILELVSMKCQVGIVVGGGNFVRGRELETRRVAADQMGMLATMINGIVLREAIVEAGGRAGVLSAIPVEGMLDTFTPDLAEDFLDRGYVVVYVGGTGNPLLTTDTAAALRAVQTRCERLLKGTKVDGVYESDPSMNPDARRLKTISYRDVLKYDLKVMDAAAVAVCRDAGLPINVFDIREPENLVRVYRDPFVGSLIEG